jgi:PAS domain S-box-containing protein
VRRHVTGRLVSLRDATDRRRAEEALRQSEAHFRALFEESPDACYLIDLDGRFVDANRAAEALIGQTRIDLLGKSLAEAGLLSAEDLPRAAARLARAAEGATSGIDEFALIRHDGTRVDIEVSSSRVELGGRALLVGVARDVTARREAERALRESEERYRTLVESIEELICVHDLDGRILSINRAGVQRMGYERATDLVGHCLAEFLAPAVRNRFPAYLQAIARNGWADGLMRVVTGQGEIRELEFCNRLGRDGRGVPVVWGVSRDVTERRRIERELRALNEQLEQRVQERTETLRRTQERFEALAGMAPVGIFRTGPTGEMRYVNEAWGRITGLAEAESLGTGYLDMVHPEDRERFRAPWPRSAAESGGVFEWEGRLRRRDGSVAWVVMRTRPESPEPGAPGCFVGTMTDITAFRVAEEERRKLASLVENSPELIGIAGMDARMLYVNAAGRALLGLGPAADVTTISSLAIATPESRALAKHTIAAEVLAGRTWEGELAVRRFDRPGTVDVALRAFAIRDAADAGPVLIALVARDVAERKRAEAAIRDRDDQLRQAQKMEAVGRLAGGVAHDFNNLLTVILGQSQLLSRDLDPNDPRSRPTQAIQRAADRAAALTRQLLTFSRKQVLQTAVIDLNEIVHAIGGLLRRVIGEDIELSVRSAERPAVLNGDRSQIEQVLMNLAVNARDAMPQGGHLTLEIKNAVLDAAALHQSPGAAPGPYVVLGVTDTGTGMPPEVQARIFEPFFTTKPAGKGTGLGLATVYGIVHQHGGVIAVETAMGRGTTFRVALPALTEATPAAAVAEERLAEGHETVLLAEDEPDVRALVRLYLETLGYTVLEAGGPEEALALAARHGERIDLLLSDVIMPRMSGRELADALRGRRPDLPVLFMSGYSHDVFAQHGVDTSHAALIEKPFTLEHLSVAVRGVLDA